MTSHKECELLFIALQEMGTMSYHFILFAVKTNSHPLSFSAELKFHLAIITILIPHGFHGHEILAVAAAILGLRIAAFCFTASVFVNLQ